MFFSTKRVPFRLNPDVFLEILSYFAISLENPERTTRRDLVSLALACRAFEEPALCMLWRSMRSIYPLIRILCQGKPQGLWLMSDTFPANQTQSWGRFDFYASMIKEFSFTFPIATHEMVDIKVYITIIKSRRGCLFPNLQTLSLDLRIAPKSALNDLDCLMPALSERSLQCVKIRKCIALMHTTKLTSILDTLLFLCPNIHSITIDGESSDTALHLITRFRNLRYLHLGPSTNPNEYSDNGTSLLPTSSFLEELCKAPHLQELVLDLTRCNDLFFGTKSLLDFKTLTTLAISGYAGSVLQITGRIYSLSLSRLDLQLLCSTCESNITTTHHHIHRDALVSVIGHVSDCWSHSMLALRIEMKCGVVGGRIFPDSFLVPLVSLTRLRSLELLDCYSVYPSFPDSENSWSKFQQNLKYLRVLHLPHTSALSLPQLHTLATNLPLLHTLTLTMSLQEIPALDSLPFLSHGLDALIVSHSYNFPSDRRQANQVLCHLYRMFPYLKRIECDHSPSWSLVPTMIDLLSSVVEHRPSVVRHPLYPPANNKPWPLARSLVMLNGAEPQSVLPLRKRVKIRLYFLYCKALSLAGTTAMEMTSLHRTILDFLTMFTGTYSEPNLFGIIFLIAVFWPVLPDLLAFALYQSTRLVHTISGALAQMWRY